MPNIKAIIIEHLQANGFDGLCCEDGGCGCLSELCEAGHWVMCSCGDWVVTTEKLEPGQAVCINCCEA